MRKRISRITIQIKVEEHHHLKFGDFINELKAIYEALRQTEQLVSGRDEALTYYEVVDISHNSPVKIVLEPQMVKLDYDYRRETAQKFIATAKQLGKGRPPAEFDLDF